MQLQLQLQCLSWNSHDYDIYIYPIHSWLDSICLLQTDTYSKTSSIIQMIWKVTYTNKQMWQNEANSSIHLLSVCSYIPSVTHSSLLGCATVPLGGQCAALQCCQNIRNCLPCDTASHPRIHESCARSIIRSKVQCTPLHGQCWWNVVLLIHPNTHGSIDEVETCHTAQKSGCRPIVCMNWQPFGTHRMTVTTKCTTQLCSAWIKPLQYNFLPCSGWKWFFFHIAHAMSKLLRAVLMEMSRPSTT